MKSKAHSIWKILAVLMLSSQLVCTNAHAVEGAPEKQVLRLVVQMGHSSAIISLVFSPNGRILVTGGGDGHIKLWDVASGRELRTLVGDLDYVNSVAFSPDGKILASGNAHSTDMYSTNIKLWDVASGKELRTLLGHARSVTSVAFSPDGKMLVSGSWDSTLKLWDVASGKEIKSFKAPGMMTNVLSIAFSPDGQTLVAGYGDKTIKLWDVRNGDLLFTLKGHAAGPIWGESVYSVAFSANGKTIASGSVDKTIKLWDVATGRELRTLSGHGEAVRSVAFSSDGRTLASASDDKTVKVWDLESGKTLSSWSEDDGINAIAFSPDGRTLASGSWQGKLREVFSGKVLLALASDANSVDSVSISPNGQSLIAGGGVDSQGKLWNLMTGQMERSLVDSNGFPRISFSPDGHKALAISSGGLKHWDLASGLVLPPFPLKPAAGFAVKTFWDKANPKAWTLPDITDSPSAFAFSSNGKTLVAGYKLGGLILWDVVSGHEIRSLKGHPSSPKGYPSSLDSVVISPDGKTIASGSGDKTIKLWDVATGSELHTMRGHDGGVYSVAFSPDGRQVVSTSADHTLKIWDVATGKELHTLSGHQRIVVYFAISPDGNTLVSASADKTLKIWNMATGKELRTLNGHLESVYSVVFTSDGRSIISSSKDNTLRVWRVADGAQLATLVAFKSGSWIVTDPEGRFDTADLEEIKGLHWVMPDDPLTPVPLEAFMKDYYEPRLLARILNGEKFKSVRALMDLNRVQPEVKITSIKPDAQDAERAVVEVEVAGASKEYERYGKKVPMTTAASDLRLFRDGQLVGYIDGQVVKQGTKPYRKTFNVHLPSAMSGHDITFSAYAFNDDRVKSQTARQTYQVPTAVVAKKGNAYLITMGVNKFENPAWNLRFAANDAHLMRQTLTDKLHKTGTYQQVVPLSLISDENEHHADKALLHAVLDRLAGKPASPLLNELPGADKLQPATPDDLVLLTFAGHGYADDSGDFYLLTQDTGKGSGKHVDAELLKHSISSEELSQWLKDVDAGDMTLIVDACQSAASVQGKDFKPGPMGSRGLGQLSFDKGMRILAASQADEYALENDKIKQGLLSFALVTNGIQGFEADDSPKDAKIMLDEWLHYGVSRVPGLAEEVKTGTVKVVSRGGERSLVRVSTTGTDKPRPAQQPALFDFAKKRRQVEVAGR